MKNTVKKKKILLIPAMLDDTFDLLKYAFESEEYHAVILKNTRNVVNTGLEHVHNDLCYPGAIIAGQLICALKSGRLDPENCVFLIAQAGDSCRGSNYLPLVKKALKKAGFDIPVISFNFLDMEEGARLSITPAFLIKALAALLCSDMLMLLRDQVKPYELEKGSTERLHKKWLKILRRKILSCKGISPLQLKSLFRQIAEDFAAVAVKDRQLKRIGIVGELYMKYCSAGNHDIRRYLDSRDVHHMTNGFSWYALYYIDTHLTELSMVNPVMAAAYKTAGAFIETMQKEMIKAIREEGFVCFDSFTQFKKNAEKYIPCRITTGDGWLIGAEICNYAELGFSRIACVQPFGCMPNHVCGRGLYSSIQRKISRVKNVQLVSVDYDSSDADVNIRNRIQMLLDFPDIN